MHINILFGSKNEAAYHSNRHVAENETITVFYCPPSCPFEAFPGSRRHQPPLTRCERTGSYFLVRSCRESFWPSVIYMLVRARK